MGKIKVRTLGNEDLENKQKEQSKIKAKEKKFVKGGKGGERIVAVGPSEAELAALEVSKEKAPETKEEIKKVRTKKNFKKAKKAPHSSSYQKAMGILDRSKKYKLNDALEMLQELKRSKFDETVELHINTTETGVSGNITLPHGTGKQIRVAIADDDLLAKVALGKIDFDILLANPSMMPKLARVAKILGPKGLMPNPKNATLVKDPEKAALEFKKGQINFRTELKAPIMHLIVGKLSFGSKKLSENIQSLIEAIKREKIRNVTLKSTMSPGVKLEI
jgi:large subunit ribosomal protein L1